MSGADSPTSEINETRLVVSRRLRSVQRLDALSRDAADPEMSRLLALRPPSGTWLWGGEPTLRPDLPTLLGALDRPRLRTDALALASQAALSALQSAGLAGMRVVLHSARSDAHDWLVGLPGAHKRAVRAIRLAVAAGLSVELEATLTRSTLPYIVELVELAARLSVSAVHVRRITAAGPAAAEQVMLTPRIAQARQQLSQAVQLGRSRGVPVTLWGFPHCVCPDQPSAFAAQPTWLRTGRDTPRHDERSSVTPRDVLRCRECPEACPGAPADYVDRFGPLEFVAAPSAAPAVVRVAFCAAAGTPIPTRELRLRLMRAAQVGATTLRVADGTSLSHPAAAQLLRECTRLSFERLELCGEGSGLAALTSGDLYPLRSVSRVDLGLMGADAPSHDAAVGRPGAFEATLEAVARIRKVTGVKTALYCASEQPEVVAACEAAWETGDLPGVPTFRIAGEPGALFTFDLQNHAPADLWDRLYSPR